MSSLAGLKSLYNQTTNIYLFYSIFSFNSGNTHMRLQLLICRESCWQRNQTISNPHPLNNLLVWTAWRQPSKVKRPRCLLPPGFCWLRLRQKSSWGNWLSGQNHPARVRLARALQNRRCDGGHSSWCPGKFLKSRGCSWACCCHTAIWVQLFTHTHTHS